MKSNVPSLWSNGGRLVDPFRTMQQQMNEFFNEFGRGLPSIDRLPTVDVGFQVPAINVAETNEAFDITAELPGVDAKDIQVTVRGNRLILSGEKREESEQKDKDWQVVERSYGSFRRAIALPFEINESAIAANFDKGVLHLKVRKPAQLAKETSKKIEIKVGPAPQTAPATPSQSKAA